MLPPIIEELIPEDHVCILVESFIKTLKYEEVYLKEYRCFSDALENIGDFIDDVYNKKRLHSSIGYRSPEVFEMEVKTNKLT